MTVLMSTLYPTQGPSVMLKYLNNVRCVLDGGFIATGATVEDAMPSDYRKETVRTPVRPRIVDC